MRKINLLLFVSIFTLISSCSSDEDTSTSSSSTNLIKDMTTSSETNNYRTDYIYEDGNKLARFFSSSDTFFDTEVRFTYSGDIITEYKTWFNGQLDTRVSLGYTDGRLSSWNMYVYDDETEYFSNVSYINDKMIFDLEVGNVDGGRVVHHFDNNGNTIKIEQYNSSDQLISRDLYSYDSKNAPTKNILSFDSFIYPWERGASINNVLTINHTDYNVLNGSIENETNTSYIYEYNDQNYPVYMTYNFDGNESSSTITYY